ncbi:MAG: alpha/beta fold hydrolase [Burkholderiaceae bacterium]|nr:alpha/beta fold hydrolase [Burkholderiaceae bacterium]
MLPLIHFVHGKESGPWGRKITYLSAIARQEGFDIESLDYSDISNPMERADKLAQACAGRQPDILVGSSMGGWVAATATATVKVRGLFLMAPAFYMPDYPSHRLGCDGSQIDIVHGWRDSVIPLQHSVRFGQEHRCTLHLIDDDHRLAERLDLIGQYFTAFLRRTLAQ